MKKVRIDWHIHTTLSPCGSLQMDPWTILDRAGQRKLQVIGITDHNSTRQGRLMKSEYQECNIMILTGAEVTTREEIHCLAFFDELNALDKFQEYLDLHLPAIPNNALYFGDQVVVNSCGNIVYEEDVLLISALDQSFEQVGDFVRKHDGIFIPAHINRPAFSLLSQLGMIPSDLQADALEWVKGCPGGLPCDWNSISGSMPVVFSSDAHLPEEIGMRYTEMEFEEWSFQGIKSGLTKLNGGVK